MPAAWRAIEFASDLHLGTATPRTLAAFERWLAGSDADAVFLLGDVFEMWVGDDVPAGSIESRVGRSLRAAADRGLAVHVMAGNRDFLVGPRYLAAAGATGLADPTIVDAFGGRLVVSHGDLLCTGDTEYLRFRRIVRRPVVRALFAALPRRLRAALGRETRARSHGGEHRADPDPRYDADDRTALAWLESMDAPRLLHGHTHRPARHALADGRERIVLADWDLDHGAPRGDVVRWTAAGLERRPVPTSS